jgi:uncharacterized membrane protein YeaQ/YmgE (transglycosylase-associated protein family)
VFNYYFNIGLIYFLIGFAIALYYVFILRKRMLGRFWGALLVSVVGAFLGGIVEYFFSDTIAKLSNLMNAVNIFPAIIMALLLLWIFSKVNRGE